MCEGAASLFDQCLSELSPSLQGFNLLLTCAKLSHSVQNVNTKRLKSAATSACAKGFVPVADLCWFQSSCCFRGPAGTYLPALLRHFDLIIPLAGIALAKHINGLHFYEVFTCRKPVRDIRSPEVCTLIGIGRAFSSQ